MKNQKANIVQKWYGTPVLLTVAVAFALLTTAPVSAFSFENPDFGYMEISDADSSKIYNVVDEMPEVKGGLNAIYKHIKYPRSAASRGIEGRVFIKFVVDENGEVSNPEILKDIGSGCGDAAVEGIKNVEFIPGKLNGQPVKVYYTLPVNFELTN